MPASTQSNTPSRTPSIRARKVYKAVYPELHHRLKSHRLSEHSCVGLAKWEQEGPMVSTQAWFRATGGSCKRGWQDAKRSDYVWNGSGAITGEPSLVDPPVFGWQPYVRKAFRDTPGIGGNTSTGTSIGSRTRQRSGSTTSSQRSGGSSLQSAGDVEWKFPPSPAFIRNYMRGAVATDEAQEEEDEPMQRAASRETADGSGACLLNRRRPPRGKAATLLARLAQSQPALPTAAEEDEAMETASAFHNWKVPVVKRKSYFETLDHVTQPFPDGDLPFLKLRCGTPCESARNLTSPFGSTKPPTTAVESLQATTSSWVGGFQPDLDFPGLASHTKIRRGALTKMFLEARLPRNKYLGQAARDVLLRGRRKEFDPFEEDTEIILRSAVEHVGAVFALLSKQSVLDVQHQLGNALLLLDHPYPNFSWLHQAIADHCSSRDVVDLEDFGMTINAFEDSRHDFLSTLFAKNSVTDGKVSVGDLPRMLEIAGVSLMAGAADELCSAAGKFIDFNSFVTIYEDASERAGLTIAEYNRALSEFKSQSGTGDGWETTEQHLRSSLAWSDTLTRLAGGEAVVGMVVAHAMRQTRRGKVVLDLKAWQSEPPAGADDDDSEDLFSVGDPSISGSAFLMAFRVMHHLVSRALKDTPPLAKLNIDVDLLKHGDLLDILEHIGEWSCTADRVNETLISCGLRADEEAYTFGQAYTLILNYCLSEGITTSELSFLGGVFLRFDSDCSGCLDIQELGVAIRWMGYQPPLYRLYNFVEELGLERKSRFTFQKFTRLMGRFIKSSLATVRRAFMTPGEPKTDEMLPAAKLKSLLGLAGYRPSLEEINILIEEAGGIDAMLDFRSFKQLEQLHRDGVRSLLEENNGCTACELTEYKECFHQHSVKGADGTEHFDPKAMRAVLQDRFPDTGLCKQRYERLSDVVKQLDSDSNGKLDLDEFIRMMAVLTSDDEQDLLVRAIALKDELGYSSADMRNLRELFNVADTSLSGDISFDELVQIVSKMVCITVTSKRELQTMLGKVDDGDGNLDFWEFLRFVRHLQDTNWRNINGITGYE